MVWEPRTRDDEWRVMVLEELREIRRLLQRLPGVQAAEEAPSAVGVERRCPRCGKAFLSGPALGGHLGKCKGGGRKL